MHVASRNIREKMSHYEKVISALYCMHIFNVSKLTKLIHFIHHFEFIHFSGNILGRKYGS